MVTKPIDLYHLLNIITKNLPNHMPIVSNLLDLACTPSICMSLLLATTTNTSNLHCSEGSCIPNTVLLKNVVLINFWRRLLEAVLTSLQSTMKLGNLMLPSMM